MPTEWLKSVKNNEFVRVELNPDEADELSRYMDLDQTYSIQDDEPKEQMLTNAMRAFVYTQLQEQDPSIINRPPAFNA
jgi:hypothetical protein